MVVWNSGIGVEGAMAVMVDGGAPDVVNGDLDMVPTGNIAQGMHPTIHVPPLAVVPMLIGHHALGELSKDVEMTLVLDKGKKMYS